MRKATNKSKSNHSNEHGVEDVDVVTDERRNNVTKDKKGTENRNVSSIKTYINFYYYDDVDNNACNIKVDGELISLNTLFVDVQEQIPVGVNRRKIMGIQSIVQLSTRMVQLWKLKL